MARLLAVESLLSEDGRTRRYNIAGQVFFASAETFSAAFDFKEVIEHVTIEEGHIQGRTTSGGEFLSYAPAVTEDLLKRLEASQVEVDARPKPEGSFWRQVLIMWFPLVLFIGLWIFFIRQMQAGA